ncbi:MAG: hypothetical protein R8G60_04775 [Roseovarius pacificus]|nr:hypothetical protein [Roseovarius pacificus]
MKPNFALSLSFEGIRLLHRAFPGWHDVGEVSLEVEDLPAELTALRERAQALTASPMICKLVIPDAQIKYLTFDGQGATGEALEQAVRTHLDGATPYALDDLAYDWSFEAGQVHVAAVAHETLAEAEDFATLHGFAPVSFVARPAQGRFVGEPWFGETAQSAQHLPEGDTLERDTAPVRIIGPAPVPDATKETAAEDETPAAAETPPEPEAPAAAPAPSDSDDNAPATAGDDAPDTGSPQDDDTDPDKTDDTPAAAFRSIRASRGDPPPSAPRRLEGAARGFTPVAPGTANSETSAAPPVTGTPQDAMSDAAVADLAASLAATEADETPAPDPASPAEDDSPVSSFFTRRSARIEATAPTPPPPGDEKQRMTVFGAREPVASRGKPRYLGLILTAVLLLFLVAVAAWASVFLDDGIASLFRKDDQRQIVATPDIDLPEDDPEAQADAALTQPDDQPTEPPAEAPDPAPQTIAAPADLSADEVRARYAATGIWQMAPDAPTAPGVLTLDDFYQTSIDSQVKSSDAVALPDPSRTPADTRPETPGDPPAAGTRFRFDNRGLVVATPDGALTPQGVPVYAGPPALTPPQLPDRPEAIVTDLPNDEVLRLMGVRPRLRPDTLSEQNERGSLGLGGRTRVELAALRPRLRPESAQEAAMAAAQAATAEAEAAQTAAATTDPQAVAAALAEAVQAPDPFASATEQAVSASLKPNSRPRNFDKVVARTTQAARAAPVSASQKVTPNAPTTTTVARAATDKNAISMRQVNLIGVYGSPSNRRALVRLANGRYQKVKVGDRLDGGQVAAIGDSELRYQKRGRSIVLRMPRG